MPAEFQPNNKEARKRVEKMTIEKEILFTDSIEASKVRDRAANDLCLYMANSSIYQRGLMYKERQQPFR